MMSHKGIATSDYFCILASNNYVNAIEDPRDSEHHILTSQVIRAKALGKSIIVVWIKGVSEENRDKLRVALGDADVIGELEGNDHPTQGLAERIAELMDR